MNPNPFILLAIVFVSGFVGAGMARLVFVLFGC